jgi:murein DD-endopeptidase MepM/ murein hydrolase activator NlpD
MPTTPRHDLDTGDGLLAHAVVDPFAHDEQLETARRRRRRQRLAAFATAFTAFAALAAIVAQVGLTDTDQAAGPAPKVAVSAEGIGITLLRPGHEPQHLAASRPVVGVSAREQGAHASWQLAGVATVDRITTTARVAVGARSAAAQSRVERIDLLDGRIQLTNARIDAAAASTDGRAAGSITLAPTTTLLVDGVAHEPTLNERIAIEGVGTIIINEQAVVANAPTGDAQTGPRYRTVGAIAHLRVTQDAAGLPAGSELVIGRVDAGVREGKIRRIDHADPTVATPVPAAPVALTMPGLQLGAPKPGETALPRRPIGVRGSGGAAGVPASAGLRGYLFPILGSSNYVDTWGAARASTGVPHQGTDIFAEEGTPIVAIADGVLDRVGWNTIGGYRFWLFDGAGNSFYHAHLSAFSPLARDGARVRRGDVIGFVGHTGDAQYTPPHLHFEVHPGNGEPTNPFAILNAWRKGVAVAIGVLHGNGGDRIAPLALLNFSDISSSGGLRSSVLDRVPDTHERTIDQETEPRPTDESLKGAIEGPATTASPAPTAQ